MTSLENKTATKAQAQDGTGVIELDPWLEPYRGALKQRLDFLSSIVFFGSLNTWILSMYWSVDERRG